MRYRIFFSRTFTFRNSFSVAYYRLTWMQLTQVKINRFKIKQTWLNDTREHFVHAANVHVFHWIRGIHKTENEFRIFQNCFGIIWFADKSISIRRIKTRFGFVHLNRLLNVIFRLICLMSIIRHLCPFSAMMLGFISFNFWTPLTNLFSSWNVKC